MSYYLMRVPSLTWTCKVSPKRIIRFLEQMDLKYRQISLIQYMCLMPSVSILKMSKIIMPSPLIFIFQTRSLITKKLKQSWLKWLLALIDGR